MGRLCAGLNTVGASTRDPCYGTERASSVSPPGARGGLVDVHGPSVIVRSACHLDVLVSEGDGVDPPSPDKNRCQSRDDIADGAIGRGVSLHQHHDSKVVGRGVVGPDGPRGDCMSRGL